MRFLPSREAVRVLGVHPNTLRRWANSGKIKYERMPGGNRLYDVDGFLGQSEEPTGICYCRVSSHNQRRDLKRQVEYMRNQFPDYEIVKDIGSGLNYKRKGLQSLLGRVLDGDKLEIVVAHKDRLVRFGFELIELLVERNGGSLVVLDDSSLSPERELTEDLLAILHVFSCRLYGRRLYKVTQDTVDADQGTGALVQTLAEHLQVRVQSYSRVPAATRNKSQLAGD